MSEVPTVKLPVWAVTVIVGLLLSIISGVVYVVETRTIAKQNDERLRNIEQGVHQIWERLLDKEGR